MRFVPTFCLREDMVLAKNIYGKNGDLMLRAGTTLNTSYLDGIKRLGYNGIYVDDDLSRDIEVIGIINDNLRRETIKGIKDVFIYAEKQDDKDQNIKIEKTKKFVENIIDEIIENKNLMVNMVDLKVFDDYTFYHSLNVAVLSLVMGVALNLNRSELYKLGIGALFHDVGKVFINKEVINKPGKLSYEEFEEIKKHSEFGYKYLKQEFDIPIKAYVGALEHHERYDGTGYPCGKKGSTICLFGRIISIADVYDALTSDRPYKKAYAPSEAMEYIMANCGNLFDPELVSIFVQKVAPYPIGTCVKLSNGKIGIVLKNYEDCCLRPKIRIFKDNDRDVEYEEIDLKYDGDIKNVTIIGVAEI